MKHFQNTIWFKMHEKFTFQTFHAPTATFKISLTVENILEAIRPSNAYLLCLRTQTNLVILKAKDVTLREQCSALPFKRSIYCGTDDNLHWHCIKHENKMQKNDIHMHTFVHEDAEIEIVSSSKQMTYNVYSLVFALINFRYQFYQLWLLFVVFFDMIWTF